MSPPATGVPEYVPVRVGAMSTDWSPRSATSRSPERSTATATGFHSSADTSGPPCPVVPQTRVPVTGERLPAAADPRLARAHDCQNRRTSAGTGVAHDLHPLRRGFGDVDVPLGVDREARRGPHRPRAAARTRRKGRDL